MTISAFRYCESVNEVTTIDVQSRLRYYSGDFNAKGGENLRRDNVQLSRQRVRSRSDIYNGVGGKLDCARNERTPRGSAIDRALPSHGTRVLHDAR